MRVPSPFLMSFCVPSRARKSLKFQIKVLCQGISRNLLVHLLGRQTLNCLSSLNADPMLVTDAQQPPLTTFSMERLDGAGPKLLSCENPTHLNVDAGTLTFRMTMKLCI